MTRLVQYVEERLRRPLPAGIPVVAGSTPVLSFGDPTVAEVATLGLNPSRAEFLDAAGQPLTGAARRLVDLPSLGIDALAYADSDHLGAVVEGCDRYFSRAPYWRWFKPLDALLQTAFSASYRDGSACHLDLSQWATDPVWNGLSREQHARLLEQDGPFLTQQLAQENVSVLLLNGRSVVEQVCRAGLAEVEQQVTVSNASRRLSCQVYAGTAGSTAVYGWSSNLQSQPGVDGYLKQQLAEVLANLRPTTGAAGAPVSGSIREGTQVPDKAALAELLRTWWRTTDEPTIGDVARYGGRPYVTLQLCDVRVVLNADTKRAAVERYLKAVDEHGPDLAWQVVQGRSKLNKVVYQGLQAAAGWYAYAGREMEAPRWL